MSIDLRAAQPTIEDGLEFARFFDAASDGLAGLMMGGRSDQIVAKAFIEPGHDMSFEYVTFANDGDTIGMLSAYSAADHQRATDSALFKAAGWRSARLAVVATLGSPVFNFLDRLDEGDFYIQAVAVDPSRRGQGIGTRLLEHAETMARSSGAARLVLDVDTKNSSAIRLYERFGMSIVDTSRRAWLLGGTRLHRMARPLS